MDFDSIIWRPKLSLPERELIHGSPLTIPAPPAAVQLQGNADMQGLLGQNFPRQLATANSGMTTQVVAYSAVYLTKGTVITKLWWACSVVSAGVTTCKVGLYDASFNRVSISGNDATANTVLGLVGISQTAPYTVPTSGIYYVGLLFVATTIGSRAATGGTSGSAGSGGASPQLAGTQSGQTDLPTTAVLTANAATSWHGWS